MRSVLRPFVAAAIVLVGANAPAPAQQPAVAEAAPEDYSSAIFKRYDRARFARRFGDALATAGELRPDRSNSEGRAVVAGMKAAALLGLRREAEARREIAEIVRIDPQEPMAHTMLFAGTLVAERSDVPATALDKLIARFPDAVRELDPELLFFFLRSEPKADVRLNEDRRIELARIGYQADTPTGDWLAAGAIAILMKRGDVSRAAELLRYVDEPQAVENMLIQKRYQQLWPMLEERAGPHLERVRESSVKHASRADAAAPDSEKLQTYANALRHAGRLDDAIALRAKLPSTIGAMAQADEQIGWAVNNVALALHEAAEATTPTSCSRC